ncbi:tetratricopeptide repeat protein [Phycicoccus sp. Soil748]|uniref:tetratricopeptide repeat protein n=1 Tax=Phycicoccus sp. Soil748 TaxID=1736397 RepID=UPI000702590F|nr:tetratricopeptide repeat protein [Phycicoccus sp. Soil748]KRE57222.1 thioredoxin [Phycicoccus sp. Soil748]
MTDQPFTAAGLRGAVDLTGLQGQPTGSTQSRPGGAGAAAAAGAGAQGGQGGAHGAPGGVSAHGVAGRTGLVVEGTDANFTEVANASVGVPLLLVLWAAQVPESRDYLDTVVGLARALDGRLQVVSVDVEQNPALLRAFQIQSVPVTLGLIQGQPVPMFAGVQPAEAVRPVLDEFLSLAVQHGVTGRVELTDDGAPGDDEVVEPPLPPLHQEAYDAIERGDLAGAHAAYTQALKENPADADAELGLAQVGLMQRTEGADLQAARAAAADRPTDVAAQTLVADLDVLGGHVEDAFLRLIDLVRATSGEEREQARVHLVQLFAVVGGHDERVKKARTALMSALF